MMHETRVLAINEGEIDRKLVELDRLLNDPDVPMEAARVWSLLAELAHLAPQQHH